MFDGLQSYWISHIEKSISSLKVFLKQYQIRILEDRVQERATLNSYDRTLQVYAQTHERMQQILLDTKSAKSSEDLIKILISDKI